MNKYELLTKASDKVRETFPSAKPLAGLILGSGWSAVGEIFEEKGSLEYSQIPGLGNTMVEGHKGRLLWGILQGVETFIFQGRRHWYEGQGWTPISAPVWILKEFQAEILFVTNAAGGINPSFKPGDLMLIRDHINMIGFNPLIGDNRGAWGPRFPDMTRVYDSSLYDLVTKAAMHSDQPISLQEGIYCAVSGPSFETPAEISMMKRIGADAVGMSTAPEAILARTCGMRVAGLSCISNFAAGIAAAPLSHEEVFETLDAVLPTIKTLLRGVWEQLNRNNS